MHYNHFKEHHGLNGRTPAEAAQVNAPFTEWADITRGPSVAVPDSERQEVEKETNVRRWARERWNTLDGHRRGETDLVWQSIPIADVMNNREKVKTRQSQPAPGFHQGSRYYVARLPDVGLAWVRVSSQWGNLPATEGKRNRPGLPEREWTLQGGKRKRDGSIPKVSQAGYIPLAEDGTLRPLERAALPKEPRGNPISVNSPSIMVKPKSRYVPLQVNTKTGKVSGPPGVVTVSRPPPARKRRNQHHEASGVVLVNIRVE